MSRVKSLVGLAMAALALAGCGPAPPSERSVTAPPAAAARIYLQTLQDSAPAIAVVAVPGGSRRLLPNAVLSTDGTVAYSVVQKGDDTLVRALDAVSGQEKAEQTVSGAYSLPAPDANPVPGGLSPNGRWLVLESQIPSPSVATPKTSRFAVVSTSLDRTARRFELKGWYRFDAIDDGADSVYLLEYLAGGGGEYRVRRFDTAKGSLDPTVIADKTELGKAMKGVRFAGYYSPDGQWHLGLYGRRSGVAFLHALPLSPSMPFAFCVDLPGKSSDIVAQMAWSGVETPDGASLYLANERLGELLELTIPTGGRYEPPQVVRRGTLVDEAAFYRLPGISDAEAKELSAQRLVLSRDGRTLYLGSERGVYVIDAATLGLRAHWLSSTPLSSLVISPDGRSLFATVMATTAQVDQLDAQTGHLLNRTEVPLTILGLERVATA